jgi:hypothetical protein
VDADPVVHRGRPLARVPVEAATGDPAHGVDHPRVVREGDDHRGAAVRARPDLDVRAPLDQLHRGHGRRSAPGG